ncbi:MAG: hypothetical protein HZA92_12665 [Verrucomicrobia bacterium]|nr:hypothetical protein [Verrucomicrobiota bacterium]
MSRFANELARHGLTLRRGRLHTLHINVGRKCNQTFRHCHVDAAPWRTEMMCAEVAERVGDWIRAHRPAVVDITGGAPKLNADAHFRAPSRASACPPLNNLLGSHEERRRSRAGGLHLVAVAAMASAMVLVPVGW